MDLRNGAQVATINQKFRTSAVAGNDVNITTCGGKESLGLKSKPNTLTVATGSKSKPNSQVATANTSLSESDEDDSVERATILQSPLKGIKRLSSGVSRS